MRNPDEDCKREPPKMNNMHVDSRFPSGNWSVQVPSHLSEGKHVRTRDS